MNNRDLILNLWEKSHILIFIRFQSASITTITTTNNKNTGDSGGPLIFTTNNQDYHIGTVSWGEGCGSRNKPGVYSRTSTRADWIKATVCDTFNEKNDKNAILCNGGGGDNPVTAPVTAPTPSPVGSTKGCDGKGGKELVIELTTDDFPEDSSYTVKDLGNGNKLLVRKNFEEACKLDTVRIKYIYCYFDLTWFDLIWLDFIALFIIFNHLFHLLTNQNKKWFFL